MAHDWSLVRNVMPYVFLIILGSAYIISFYCQCCSAQSSSSDMDFCPQPSYLFIYFFLEPPIASYEENCHTVVLLYICSSSKWSIHLYYPVLESSLSSSFRRFLSSLSVVWRRAVRVRAGFYGMMLISLCVIAQRSGL